MRVRRLFLTSASFKARRGYVMNRAGPAAWKCQEGELSAVVGAGVAAILNPRIWASQEHQRLSLNLYLQL